jgi:hypothetical protein
MPDISKIRIDHLVLTDVPAHRRSEIRRVVEQAAIAAARSPGAQTGPALEARIGSAVRKAVSAALAGHPVAHVPQDISHVPEASHANARAPAAPAQGTMGEGKI